LRVPLALLVAHAKQSDGLDQDHAPREGGLGDDDHHVEGVAVVCQRLGDVAVVGRVHERAEQEAVELYCAEPLVPLVLVPAPLGDLDDAVKELVVVRARLHRHLAELYAK